MRCCIIAHMRALHLAAEQAPAVGMTAMTSRRFRRNSKNILPCRPRNCVPSFCSKSSTSWARPTKLACLTIDCRTSPPALDAILYRTLQCRSIADCRMRSWCVGLGFRLVPDWLTTSPVVMVTALWAARGRASERMLTVAGRTGTRLGTGARRSDCTQRLHHARPIRVHR